MPQIRFTPDKPPAQGSIRFTPDAPEQERSLMDEISSFLPSRRTALQTGGAIAGGALGAVGGPLGIAAGGALGAGTGESIEELIARATGGDAPETSNDAMGRIGSAMTGGALQEGIGAALPGLANWGASKLYRSSLKPSVTLPRASVQRAVDTGLREGIPISEGGVNKLNDRVGALGKEVDAIVSQPGPMISSKKVARRADDLIPQFQQQVNPADDVEAILGAKREFLGNQPPFLTGSEAQAIKSGTYRQLKDKAYGELKTSSIEGQKALARGLKEEIEAAYPAVNPLNQRQSDLFSLQRPLERAVDRISNRDVIGAAPVIGGAIGGLTGSPTAGVLASLAKMSPNVTSRTAIAMSRLGRALRYAPAAGRLLLDE